MEKGSNNSSIRWVTNPTEVLKDWQVPITKKAEDIELMTLLNVVVNTKQGSHNEESMIS